MPDKSITLLELNNNIRLEINQAFPDSYWVTAEISEIRINHSGHCYLELVDKDDTMNSIVARSKANIWNSTFRLLKPYFETSTGRILESGIKILFNATIEYHELYGFSLNIKDIDPTYTLGDLEKKKQEIIKKLEDEGVIDINKSLVIPVVPQRIAVISSDTAAGYGDFSNSIQNNSYNYYFDLNLFPAVMQGSQSEASIIEALDNIFSQEDQFDVVIIIRGGGSKADLSCFDSYLLALNIAQFPLPVITGIGHERDESIIDIVANTKTKTPTAAAEFLITQFTEFETKIDNIHKRIIKLTSFFINDSKREIDSLKSNLNQLIILNIERNKNQLGNFERRLSNGIKTFFSENKHKLELLSKSSTFLDPKRILKRGFSITLKNQIAIKSIKDIKKDDLVETKFFDGSINSIVLKSIKNNT